MLLDESKNVAAHLETIVNGNLGDAYQTGIAGCYELIEEVVSDKAYFHNQPSTICADIGARVVNNCAATARLIACGYWTNAGHGFRYLIECTNLLELFGYAPNLASQWADMKSVDRNRKFGNQQLRRELRKYRPDRVGAEASFKFWSEIAGHPSIRGIVLHLASDGTKQIVPTIDGRRFKMLVHDLFWSLARTTQQFIVTMDKLQPADSPTIYERYKMRAATVTGAISLLEPIRSGQVLGIWTENPRQ
jgi:hypothetical protein